MQPGSMFEFTSRFLPTGQAEAVLALYALRRLICNIPYTPVDDTVKWAKLKWWSGELLKGADSPSRHPVLRVLRESGARAKISDAQLLGLVSSALMQIDAAPDSDEDAMLERLSESGVSELEVELALAEAKIDRTNLDFLAAASSLFRMISSFTPGEQAQTERLPLNLLAKYKVSTAQLEESSRSPELSLIISRIAELGVVWFSNGLSGLKMAVAEGAGTDISAHLQLRWAMEKRGLQIISRDAAAFIAGGIRYGPADAWFAWRFLRRLN